MADKHTYWREQEFQDKVSYYFMDKAMDVMNGQGSPTDSEISFARDVMSGQMNINMASKAVSTNATIAANITNDNFGGMASDVEFVVLTEYESGTGISLFRNFAEAKYPPGG